VLPFQHNFASVESYDDVDHDIMILAQRKNSQLKIPGKNNTRKPLVLNLNIGIKSCVEGLVLV